MYECLLYLRELNTGSVVVRLVLAILFGGLIGLERGRKGRPAGFRTYALVCLGAALTIMLGQYEANLLETIWSSAAKQQGLRVDVARFGAQVINGIGFLGAGTILVTGHQCVKGVTTAAGLWASACMGLAIGAGFYECVLIAFVVIYVVMKLLPGIDTCIIEKSRVMNLYVELTSLDHIGEVLDRIKAQDAQIYEVEIEHGHEDDHKYPCAIFSISIKKHMVHTQMLAAMSDMDCIVTIDEI